MSFDFASTRELVRRTVQNTLAVPCTYQDSTLAEPVALRVRWQTKSKAFGDLEDAGYAMSIEGVNRLVFDAEDLVAQAVTLRRAGVVTIPMAGRPDVLLVLEAEEQNDGPIVLSWKVAQR